MSETTWHDAKVTSDQLEAYLHHKQWFQDGKIRGIATVWHQPADEEAEVVVPLAYAKDFQPRLREALAAIAFFEKREVREVQSQISRLFANVITVRVIHADTSDGTIPMSDGVLLITKAKELMLAAAVSIYSKKKQFTGAAPKSAKAYLDTLLLGQTEIGSYVVNLIAPVQTNTVLTNTTANVVPFAQAITSNLVTSLEAIAKASSTYEQNGDLKVFDDAVQAGASSNMCDALLGFSGINHNRAFEITVTASAGPLFKSEPRKFDFSSKHIELLEKVSNYYKDDYVLRERRLIGHIVKLSRPKDQSSGTITINSIVGDTQRNVRVELAGDDYHTAVLAHDNSRLVRVNGDVHIKSKSAHLLTPMNFGVIEEADLF